jgi:hypothetical protein
VAHKEIRKRVPIDLTITQWRELQATYPGIPMSQVLLQIHLRGLLAIIADRPR